MAGINLVNKLKGGSGGSSGNTYVGDPSGGESSSRLQQFLSAGGFLDESQKLEANDYLKLAVISLIFGGLYYASSWSDTYISKLAAEKQTELTTIQQKVKSTQDKLKSLKSFLVEAEKFEKEKTTIQTKLDTFNSVTLNRDFSVKLIDFLILNMPKTIWFESIDTDLSADPKITVTGNTMSIQDLASYMKTVEGAVFYPNWTLKETNDNNTSSTSSGGSSSNKKSENLREVDGSKRFEISAKVVKPK